MENLGNSVCGKPYCKATFVVNKSDIKIVDDVEVWPNFCPGCRMQEGSVNWEEKTYEGERWEGTPHEFRYKINKYY
jgi:hypothetical protein